MESRYVLPEDIQPDEPRTVEPGDDLVYWAWSIIANAGHNRGGWDNEDPEWVAAAIRWRDAFHASLRVDDDG